MTLGVALLGSGIFAREEHLPAVQASKDLALKAAYSRSLKSAQSLETASSVDLYSDDSDSDKTLDHLLSRADIHAVIIALPIKNQPDYIRKALTAGKHVLSEKPIAENVQQAKDLIDWYESEILPKGITWGVAENVRFYPGMNYAGEARRKHGRALTFQAREQFLVATGGKYFETSWRKTPTHQGGFLLDGGVHFVASLRLLLGKDDPLLSLSAYTAQLQEHLPPVDTIEAVAMSKSGAVGHISISFGTTAKGSEYHVGSENGYVSVSSRSKVIVDKDEKEIPQNSGVKEELIAWGEGLRDGKANPLQSPREALADLEIIETCLKSGEQGRKSMELKYQQL